MDKEVIFSRKTPIALYRWYMDNGFFDPCPYQANFDGLNIEWKERNFVNPPYSKLKLWVKKCIDEHKKGKKIVLLIPARTDTKAFKMLFDYGAYITFIIGRLRFSDKGNAPFPSMLVVLNGNITYCDIMEVKNLFR